MQIFGAQVGFLTQDFLRATLKENSDLDLTNSILKSRTGISNFFGVQDELHELKERLLSERNILEEPDRAEYGDFQTSLELASSVVKLLREHIYPPEILIEPTCGKGNFILAVLEEFPSLQQIYGIEIYKPYVWEAKFSIVEFFLKYPHRNKPRIVIDCFDVFNYRFAALASAISTERVLVLGNPPWVTNSGLGVLNSDNLPSKTNFKRLSGLDAMTGKGNFDIAEYIILQLLVAFQKKDGVIALLVKNSVIRNIVFDQKKRNYKIGSLEKYCIDSKKEFDVSVEAALFFCRLNEVPSYICSEFNFYQRHYCRVKFGWINDKFVSNVENYIHSQHVDGNSPFTWRQGIKHDCSKVMELDKVGDNYRNAYGKIVELEEDLVYGILKSSDLKSAVISSARKFTIVPQNKVGQDTSYLKYSFSKTFSYLMEHLKEFEGRKSSIYINKPPFSIFGIGDYSFKPYKIAISGLYKTFHFSLILPHNGKPLMLDDTCYLIGFDDIDYAAYAYVLLNSHVVKEFLESITFLDAKRPFTKDVLMRIDLYRLATQFQNEQLKSEVSTLNEKYELQLTCDKWDTFIKTLKPVVDEQLLIF